MLLVVGVPYSRPVVVSNEAQEGLCQIWNLIVRPAGSRAAGWNEYSLPTVAVVGGVPAMTGGAVALACGEESSASDVRAQSAPYRRRTAAALREGIVTTPFRNPTCLHQGGKHDGRVAPCEWSRSRSRDGDLTARWRLPDRQPRCLKTQTGGFASPPCGGFALGLAGSKLRLERWRNVSGSRHAPRHRRCVAARRQWRAAHPVRRR